MPTDATVDTLYDNLDRMRAVSVFLDNVGALSVYSVIAGNAAIGLSQPNQIAVAEKLLDSHSLYLTGNTSTMYSIGHLDLQAYGPTVVEVPPGMLGMLDDAWMRYVGDFGVAGPDRARAASTSFCHRVTPASCRTGTSCSSLPPTSTGSSCAAPSPMDWRRP